MSYDNSGAISKNDYKTEDKHPDYTGDAKIDGVTFKISAWIKERKDGSGKFLSLAFTKKEAEQQSTTEQEFTSEEQLPF